MRFLTILFCVGFAAAGVVPFLCGQASGPSLHDVVWKKPSSDASGTMPLGNGEIGLNAWVDHDGTVSFYIGKTDSWGDNGRLLKVGRLRIKTDPPLPVGGSFEQTLRLVEGAMVLRCGGDGQEAVVLRLWVDAHRPMIHVTIDGMTPRTATAEIDLWRTEKTPYPLCEVSDLLEDRSKPDRRHRPIFVEPDTVVEGLAERIGWYHFNKKSVGPKLNAELQGLSSFFEGKSDPLLHRIFGALVETDGGERLDDRRLRSKKNRGHRFSIAVHTAHPSDPKAWLEQTQTLLETAAKQPFDERRQAHEDWWRAFWQRSWIHLKQVKGKDPIPRNPHEFRIGVDPNGGNRFVGEFGRFSFYSRCLTAKEIVALADPAARVTPLPGSPVAPAYSVPKAQMGPIVNSAPTPGLPPNSAAWTFPGGLTIEAWIKPGELPPGGGRIVDKVTPGVGDGLLFDTYPGRSLRLGVGSRTIQAANVLAKDGWTHVAATVDAQGGGLALYVDGEMVADDASSPLDDAEVVSRAYALQRWIDACAGRGRHPIKFNGSIFTVPHEGKFGDADYRRWGPGYWWQNTRLPYLSMCASGDTEMMKPLFRMYVDEQMALHKHRTKLYTGHEGAFIPECLYFWGPTFTATYGWTPFSKRGADKLQESPWHKWEWVSGLELVWMMLDYYDHTEDHDFLREKVIPAAREILLFFDRHSPLDDRGKLVMYPSQSLETWWDCTNPTPEVAGLIAVTERLMALPERFSKAEDRSFWHALRKKTPELPTWKKGDQTLIAPAERFEKKNNVENGELYPVFPFRLVSFEKSNRDLGIRTLENRWDRGAFGWRQDGLFMAYLGLAEEARKNLVSRARSPHKGSRFPAFWGPNYDWIPDQDHGGVLMRLLQTMLMQTEGRQIFLMPAWPEGWDADFKLHAPYNTTLSGRVREGKLIDLKVSPESRRKDVRIR